MTPSLDGLLRQRAKEQAARDALAVATIPTTPEFLEAGGLVPGDRR